MHGHQDSMGIVRSGNVREIPCFDSGVCNDFGGLEENTCSGQDSSRHSKPDSVLWRFWDAGYERSCHTEGGTVDLGEIS